jgi:hypothetical protein
VAWTTVSSGCCALLGRGLCVGVITRPEKSYRMWYVVVCDLETSRIRRQWPVLGLSTAIKWNICVITWVRYPVLWHPYISGNHLYTYHL